MENFVEFLLRVLYVAFQKMGVESQSDRKYKKLRNVLCNVAFVIVCCAILGCLGTGIAFLAVGGSLRVAGIVLVSVGAGVFALLIIFIVTAICVGLRKLKKINSDSTDDNVIDI